MNRATPRPKLVPPMEVLHYIHHLERTLMLERTMATTTIGRLTSLLHSHSQRQLDEAVEVLACMIQRQFHYFQTRRPYLTASIHWLGGLEKHICKLPFGELVHKPGRPTFTRIFKTEEDIRRLFPTLLRRVWPTKSCAQLVPPMSLHWSRNTKILRIRFIYRGCKQDGTQIRAFRQRERRK
jgi:hypothetical protein